MHAKNGCCIPHHVGILVDQIADRRDLIRNQNSTCSELHAARLGGHAAVPTAVDDQGTFELGDAGDHSQHHVPGRRRRIGEQSLSHPGSCRSPLVQLFSARFFPNPVFLPTGSMKFDDIALRNRFREVRSEVTLHYETSFMKYAK